jgi:poly-gamma-glutamate capsule biosynthesis protein CapA/YwtB (metallophosphatase superfamily)
VTRLCLIGDVMLGRLVNDALSRRPPDWVWGDTLDLLAGADWRACNLECVLTGRIEPAFPGKTFHFRSDPDNVAALEAAGIDAVSLANNHVLDFGPRALVEMLEMLDRRGIGHAGAGAHLAEARRPAVTDVGGVRVGLLAASDNEPGWAATDARPGIFHLPTDPASPGVREQLLPAVRDAAGRVDLLVVSLHWGSNWGFRPPVGHRSLADTLIACGADVVFGHSAHVFRGIEVRRGRPIIYGAGDFVDDYAVHPVERNDQSLVVLVETEGRRVVRLRLRPTVIRGMQARLARDREAEEILERLALLSIEQGTAVEVEGPEAVIRLDRPTQSSPPMGECD